MYMTNSFRILSELKNCAEISDIFHVFTNYDCYGDIRWNSGRL